MNWKLLFSLSLFGVGMGLCWLTGLGPFLLFLWPIVIVTSVCVLVTYVSNKYFLHGFAVGMLIQFWAGLIHAYYIFDLSRIGLVEVLPHGIHPQLMNALETAAAGILMGLFIGGIVSFATRFPRPQKKSVESTR